MNKEYSKLKTERKLRIAIAVVLILSAILASIAWALFAKVMITDNSLRLGKIHVELGYYEEGDKERPRLYSGTQPMIKGIDPDSVISDPDVDPDAYIIDSSDYPGRDSSDPYAPPYSGNPGDKPSIIDPSVYVGSGEGLSEEQKAYREEVLRQFDEGSWKLTRRFYLQNFSETDDSDANCYCRIYIKPAPERPDDINPYFDTLGDYIEVSIYEADWIPVLDESNNSYSEKLLKTKDINGEDKPPLIDHVIANELTQAWYTDTDKGMEYMKDPIMVPAKERKNFILEMNYSEAFKHEFISSTMYEFDICVEAVQVKNQDPDNIRF